MSSGEAIRAEREKRGWSQAKLAEISGTTQQTVDRLERGETTFCRAQPDILRVLAIGCKDADPEGDSALSQRIRQRLDDLGVTAITAATQRGYSRDLIRNVLRQDSNPRADTLIAIADSLSTTVGWLLGEGPDRHEGEAAGPDQRRDSRITITAEVSVRVAAQILALIEGDTIP